ncbi:hypothetical protein V9T40_012487 [Parthenolecanium corni]|uniref:Sodium/calcium exchanger membrane region domain-containing protein n=1 Tax=Parthenolecanium corni TaxID=536013 RepID=A0AAN9TN82_9HEMI
MREFFVRCRNRKYLRNAFFKPLFLYLSVAIIFNKSTSGLNPFEQTNEYLPESLHKAGRQNENDSSSITNSTSNSTFSIEFKEGEHFPTVRFPLGTYGAILFPAIISAYLFLWLTIVCECFLVPCIQGISSRLEWSPDISAVTFMAAASSSPEMFVNILATFLTKSDVGVGTVLGSGLFAMLLVPAFCIIFSSSKVLKVEFWPILRETFAYMISIIALVIVLADNKVMWYEAVTLIIIYFMYLMILYFNDELKFKVDAIIAAIHRKRDSGSLIEPILPLIPKPESYTIRKWKVHKTILAKIEWILMWPIISVLRMTIPTFWNTRFHQLFIITFIMCVGWIGVLCYGISWMITALGNETTVPESVMGLTLLAAGMSIPETISGVIVAKQGRRLKTECI